MTADDLSRIAMSPTLGSALARAGELARRQGHIEVTLEHMLLSLCEDPDAGLVLASSNIDAERLKSDVTGYLANLPKRGAPGQGGEPGVSLDLRRILEAAAAAARGGRRREINGAIVLAAIVGDGRSPAAHMLQAQGLNFEGAIRALQRGTAASSPPSSSTEDILASARERVLSRTGLAARKAEPLRAPAPEGPAPAIEPPESEPALDDEPEAAPEAGGAQEPEPAPAAAVGAPPPAAPPPAVLPPASPPSAVPPPAASPPVAKPVSPAAPPPIPPAQGLPAASDGPVPGSPPPFRPAPTSGSAGLAPPPPPIPPPIPPRIGDGLPGPVRVGAAEPPPPPAHWAEEPRRPMGVGAGDAGAPGRVGALLRERGAPGLARPESAGRPVPKLRAEIGQLVENIPRTMRVAIPVLVEVRIAKAKVQALAEGLQGGGAAYHHEVTITKAMSVRLRAPDSGFFIETASPETQWIERAMLLSNEDYASWRWHVTPREKGKKRLQLVISARTIGADGLAAETALPDQVITVRVKTNYAKTASHVAGWGVAALVGGLLAKFGEGLLDMGMSVVAKLTAG